MRYVIIGGSIAGISAAKEIRKGKPSSEITVVSEEKTKAYYRPMIPYLIEKEGIDVAFPEDLEGKYGLKYVFERAVGIDVPAKEVRLSSGRLVYDRLLIATGSGPIMPDLPGLAGSGVFPLRTMEDALGIKSFARGKRIAVVMGGGFVGTKAAIALRNLGMEVTMIEKLGQVLPQRLDERASKIVSDLIKAAGINIILNDSIAEIIRSSGAVKSVRLSSGAALEADIIVIGVGTRPNVEAFRDSGIRINKGILINELLQTSVADIYAAGDVVEYEDLISGVPSVSALWTNAEEMGRFAGKNMAGGKIKYRGFLSVMNSTDILGVPVISVGTIEPAGKEYDVIVEDDLDRYRKLVFKGDSLVGALFVGDVTNAGIYTNLIKNRIPLGDLKEAAIQGELQYIDFVAGAPAQGLAV